MKEDSVRIFDTTLRDGIHGLKEPLPLAARLKIARQLDALEVDVIEAGYPGHSLADREALPQIAKWVEEAQVAALASGKREDIEAAAKALEKAKRPRLHIYFPTAAGKRPKNREQTQSEWAEKASDAVRLGKIFCDDIDFSPLDATRTEEDFLAGLLEAAIQAGAQTINLSDTVGAAVPGEMAALVQAMRASVPSIGQAVISVHCHNDLGLAVANSLAAIEAGARQVECTVNGIGERAGNAALEEIVMALHTRKIYYGMGIRIDTGQILAASRLVAEQTGLGVPANKAIVGGNAFYHRLKIPENEFAKNNGPLEGIDPAALGVKKLSD